jgi:hypothetical protein
MLLLGQLRHVGSKAAIAKSLGDASVADLTLPAGHALRMGASRCLSLFLRLRFGGAGRAARPEIAKETAGFELAMLRAGIGTGQWWIVQPNFSDAVQSVPPCP